MLSSRWRSLLSVEPASKGSDCPAETIVDVPVISTGTISHSEPSDSYLHIAQLQARPLYLWERGRRLTSVAEPWSRRLA